MVFVWIKIAGDNCSVAESANKLFNELIELFLLWNITFFRKAHVVLFDTLHPNKIQQIPKENSN